MFQQISKDLIMSLKIYQIFLKIINKVINLRLINYIRVIKLHNYGKINQNMIIIYICDPI